ncbi:MAG: putative sulfate exporter family transporter [Marinilabiliaceae bacterium]|jgi:uncharacterized membrane protein YadS|nr:putative sulfate exporter family transporter [Marinilabiliaceae bacterium]
MSEPITKKKWYSGTTTTEDWWSVWIGFTLIFLGLFSLLGVDLTGWVAYPSKWMPGTDYTFLKGLKPLGSAYSSIGFLGSLMVTYAVLTVIFLLAARAIKWDVKKFWLGWTILFFLTYLLWVLGQHAYFAADATSKAKYGLDHVLSLGGGSSYILALFTGLVIGNFIKPVADILRPAAKPELYIKIAIVLLGVKVGMLAFQASGFIFDLAIAGAAATIVAYLIFWPGTYFIARRVFKMPRKTSAVMASGISICGVSAAVATAGAVRAKPLIPVMVSALIVIYAVIELVLIPPIFTHTMIDQPVVAGAAMGMSIKTDGADAAAGAIMDEMMRSRKLAMDGTVWEEGFITTSAIMTKIWIDMFIGVWAFVLAMFWLYKVDKRPGEKIPKSEIWHRFPKFVIGYLVSWFLYLAILFYNPDSEPLVTMGAKPLEKGLRTFFFMLTFVSIGVVTDFRKLAEARFGKMVFVYLIALAVFIIPVALLVAWIFHHGMEVPII